MSSAKPKIDKHASAQEHSFGFGFLPVLILLAAAAAYGSSFFGVFLFDDRFRILGDDRLETLWPLWEALSRRRPIVDYSLAVNRAIFGQSPWGYHAVNLGVHLLSGLTLYGIVRRTLRLDGLRDRYGRSAPWLALVIAMVWVVHPLQTQSVTYVIQRAESLMGLFYLLTLYGLVHSVDSQRPQWWYVVAVVSCGLGMGSKAVIVTAPVVVLLYDRVFLSKSFSEAFRRRWLLYIGLAATWWVVFAVGVAKGVLSPATTHAHVGFGFKDITPLQYALTQFGVLVEYFKLSLWPRPLCLDYGWPVARTAGAIVSPGLVIVAAVAATVRAFVKRPALAFVGAWFFIILSPTSSFIPIRDPIFEHRMYLSLAAVVVLAVLGAYRICGHVTERLSLGDRAGRYVLAALSLSVVGSLGLGTFRRNVDYHNEAGMWLDVLAKRPDNARAHNGYGFLLHTRGQTDDALTAYAEAIRLDPKYAEAYFNRGTTLVVQGRLDEGIAAFREVLGHKPDFLAAQISLGNVFLALGRLDEALDAYREAIRTAPRVAVAHLNMGTALSRQGRSDEAIKEFREALRIQPDFAVAYYNLGNTLLELGRVDEAIEAYREALRIKPDSESAHRALQRALAWKNRSNAWNDGGAIPPSAPSADS